MYSGEKVRFQKFLSDFFERRYSKNLSTLDLDEWFDDLKDYTSDQIKLAFRDYRQDTKLGDFPPKVSSILKLLKDKKIINKFNFTCSYKDIVPCRNAGEIRYSETEKYLCLEHYECSRVRRDYEINLELKAKQLAKDAKIMNMTNLEYIEASNPKLYEKFKHPRIASRRDVQLMSKLMGK